MIQARNPPPPRPPSLQPLNQHFTGCGVGADLQTRSMNAFNHTAPGATSSFNGEMTSLSSSSSSPAPFTDFNLTNVNHVGAPTAPAPAEPKQKRKRQSKKNSKEDSIANRGNSTKESPNSINESLSILNCYQDPRNPLESSLDLSYGNGYVDDGYIDDSDVYLYDLCLGQEDLNLAEIESQNMFETYGMDNFEFEEVSGVESTMKRTENEHNRRSTSNENSVDKSSSSHSNEGNANIPMRLGAPDEYISPKRRRRLNQIVPNPRHPRTVEYHCSCCSGSYSMSVQENPWWAVFIHECPHCKSKQIPRFDINVANNAIELDPNIVALYGEGMDDDDDDDCALDDDEEDEEDEIGANQPEEECFGVGGCLDHDEASKLLVLMCHARTCTGIHVSQKHADVCKSTKFLMLHIRDCNGIDIYGNNCKFPWCLPCKKMLQHLTKCPEPAKCEICNPFTLPESFQQLQALNRHRSIPVDEKCTVVSSASDNTAAPAQTCPVNA